MSRGTCLVAALAGLLSFLLAACEVPQKAEKSCGAKPPSWAPDKPEDRQRRDRDVVRVNNKQDCAECFLQGGKIVGPLRDSHNLFKANLALADLGGIEGKSVNFKEANFDRAYLEDAVLTEVNLEGADLPNANLKGAKLLCGNNHCANLAGARLERACLQGAYLPSSAGSFAQLRDADLTGADLSGARLPGASLIRANLTGANLTDADLTGAVLAGAKLDGAILAGVDLKATNPAFLPALKAELQRTGHRQHERDVVYAIYKNNQKDMSWLDIEYYAHLVFLDWTSKYGAAPLRPLGILLGFTLFFAVFYYFAITNRRPDLTTGIWRVWPEDRVHAASYNPPPEKVVALGWHAAGCALYFSLLTAFHIGWGNLSIGNWLARIHPQEYVLRATGGTRVVAGIQSLISVYLVALSALTYFGRPFD